ncbi:MAG: hypothetical protein ACM3NS_00585 [Deltaproteobacteria bacterium]
MSAAAPASAPARASGPSLHLWPEPEARDGLGVRRSCRLERRHGAAGPGPLTLWYSLPDPGGAEPAEPHEPFLLAALVHAMAEGRDLVLHAAASAELLGNLAEFRDAWHRWRPDSYAAIAIEADRVTPRGVPRARGAGVVASYSGGVDSSFTIWRHAAGVAGHRSRRITHAVFVHGFDIPLADTAGFDAGCRRAEPLLASLGVRLVPVRTNFREVFPERWEQVYGPALAACFHQLRPLCGEALLASSRSYEVLLFPTGSNVITDPLLSSADLTVVEDGAGLNRCEKISHLAGWPAGLEALRVCWEGGQRDRNCGECEKCVRTMFNFLAAGLPVPACFDRAPTAALLERVRLRSLILAEEWAQLLRVAEGNGIGAKWVGVARRKVARYRRRVAMREAAGRLARATLPGGIRRLVRQAVLA